MFNSIVVDGKNIKSNKKIYIVVGLGDFGNEFYCLYFRLSLSHSVYNINSWGLLPFDERCQLYLF